MVLLKPIIHAMESEERPSKRVPSIRQSRQSASSSQETAANPLPSSPPVGEKFVPAEASRSHPHDVAPAPSLTEFEDFPLKHVPNLGGPPSAAPFGTALSFSSRAQAVFGSLGASLGSSSTEVNLTTPESTRASPASAEQGAVSQEVLSESLPSKDQANSWYVSGTVEQRRRKALRDDPIPSGIRIEEVEVGDGTGGTAGAGGGSRSNLERALVLGSSGKGEAMGDGWRMDDDEEDEEELQRHGWRRRAAGSREGGSFLGDASMMSVKAEAAQVAGMVGQDDTLDGEEEEDEFDMIAEGMVPGNCEDAILHVSKSGWAENFSEEIEQVNKIMGRVGDGGSTERWRQGWRPEDRAKVDREGATLRLLEDNEDMKHTASRLADRAVTGNGEHADVEMAELDSAPYSEPGLHGASACPQETDDLATKLAVQGLEDKVSHLPPPQRPTSQKTSVPDHVQNPNKYTCYTLDWSDVDQPGGAATGGSNSVAADMAEYRSALHDALSVAAASKREALTAEEGGAEEKEKGKGKEEAMDVGLLGAALPQVVPGSLGGGGGKEQPVENRVLFVKRSKKRVEHPAPDTAGTVDKETAQGKSAGGPAQGTGKAAPSASAFGMAAALMAEEDGEDAVDDPM